MYYFGARYLAPWLARWVGCDPASLRRNVNLYSYVSGNPLRLIDPLGMEEEATPNTGTVSEINLHATTFQESGLPDEPKYHEVYEYEKRRHEWFQSTFVPSANLGEIAEGVRAKTEGAYYIGEGFWQESKAGLEDKAAQHAEQGNNARSFAFWAAAGIFPNTIGEVLVPSSLPVPGKTAVAGGIAALATGLKGALEKGAVKSGISSVGLIAKLWHPFAERMRTLSVLKTDTGIYYAVRGGPLTETQKKIFDTLGFKFAGIGEHAEQQVLLTALDEGAVPELLLISKAACGKRGHMCGMTVTDVEGFVGEMHESGLAVIYRLISKVEQ